VHTRDWLWAGTGEGLTRFDRRSRQFRSYADKTCASARPSGCCEVVATSVE
jgi:hypothetical protein